MSFSDWRMFAWVFLTGGFEKKNLLGGFDHKDMAIRTSFRGNSLLPFCICFLKKFVAMPALGVVSR
jgi:hypothetical protein